MKPVAIVVSLVLLLGAASRAAAYSYCGGWAGDNIVMNPYPKPIDTWSEPAQGQMAEWNYVQGDVTRPFRVLTPPIDTIGSDDGYNSLAFLTEANLQARFGLSFADALAWTSSLHFGGCTKFVESDVIFDADGPWSLTPVDDYWFQSTTLHELGHVLGFDHDNDFFSIMNSGVSKLLRADTLYMDDREGFRDYYDSYYTLPGDTDITIYPKYHDGVSPNWMTLSTTFVDAGDVVTLHDITVENLGTSQFSVLRAGIYLSTNDLITTSDVFLGWLQWSSFGRYVYSQFDADASIPSDTASGSYYLGVIVDDVDAYQESQEGNNAIVAVDGSPSPAGIFVRGKATVTTTSSSSTTTAAPLPNTTTTLASATCPGGFSCEAGACLPIPVRPRRCKPECRDQIASCAASCMSGKRGRKCRRLCRKSTVQECHGLGHCPVGGVGLPIACTS